jgi:hypothetical protein
MLWFSRRWMPTPFIAKVYPSMRFFGLTFGYWGVGVLQVKKDVLGRAEDEHR